MSASHVFAAQAEKAIVHIYSREKGNQEATVPFPERIRSIALAGGQNGDILVLGTEGGRLILWEMSTGRRISTASLHLQPVTSLVVDPSSNFVISGSSDANIHVWSLVGLLSFTELASSHIPQQQKASIRMLSSHRAAITSLAVGHSAGRYNIVVSTSEDNTCIVWDYHTGRVLRTFLLPFAPLCVALDPADRAAYVGYEDGSVQKIDFYSAKLTQHPLYDTSLQSTPSQLSAEDRWKPPSADLGPADVISISYDGTTFLSGHRNGKILAWNIARGKYASTVADYTHPVTNLVMLRPNGLPHKSLGLKRIMRTVVKPRVDHSFADLSDSAGTAPAEYAVHTHLVDQAPSRFIVKDGGKSDQFLQALTHASFPVSIIEEGLAELAALRQPDANGVQTPSNQGGQTLEKPAAAASRVDRAKMESLESEVKNLKQLLAINETARRTSSEEIVGLRSFVSRLQDGLVEAYMKEEEGQFDRILRQARKEESETRKREAWFEAEKKGQKGDAILKEMATEDDAIASDIDGQGSDEN